MGDAAITDRRSIHTRLGSASVSRMPRVFHHVAANFLGLSADDSAVGSEGARPSTRLNKANRLAELATASALRGLASVDEARPGFGSHQQQRALAFLDAGAVTASRGGPRSGCVRASDHLQDALVTLPRPRRAARIRRANTIFNAYGRYGDNYDNYGDNFDNYGNAPPKPPPDEAFKTSPKKSKTPPMVEPVKIHNPLKTMMMAGGALLMGAAMLGDVDLLGMAGNAFAFLGKGLLAAPGALGNLIASGAKNFFEMSSSALIAAAPFVGDAFKSLGGHALDALVLVGDFFKGNR